MYGKSGRETASQLYNVAKTILRAVDNSGVQQISVEEFEEVLSSTNGTLSIASSVVSGTGRDERFVATLWENIYPPVPAEAAITGAILIIQGADDMTTEEYMNISNCLLGKLPDDAQTIISICSDESIAGSFNGSLLLTWKTYA